VALGCGATAVELFGNDHVVSDTGAASSLRDIHIASFQSICVLCLTKSLCEALLSSSSRAPAGLHDGQVRPAPRM
jgi:hypothetical protein